MALMYKLLHKQGNSISHKAYLTKEHPVNKDIFISYSRRDQEFVTRLAADRDRQVAGVWFDQSTISHVFYSSRTSSLVKIYDTFTASLFIQNAKSARKILVKIAPIPRTLNMVDHENLSMIAPTPTPAKLAPMLNAKSISPATVEIS